MVDVDFRSMLCHGLGNLEYICSPSVEEVKPEPEISREFAVIPSEAADVVAPGVAVGVVGVLDVAVVEEAVPALLGDLVGVEGEEGGEIGFDCFFAFAGGIF